MKKYIIKLLLFLFLVANISCSTTHYGYEQSAWDKLSDKQKAQVIKRFDEMRSDSEEIQKEITEERELFERTGKY